MSDNECYFCGRSAMYSVKGATDAVKRDMVYMCEHCGHAFSFALGLCVRPVVTMRKLEAADATQ